MVAVSFLFINTRNSSVENTSQSKNDVSDDLNIYDLSPIDQEGKRKLRKGNRLIQMKHGQFVTTLWDRI